MHSYWLKSILYPDFLCFYLTLFSSSWIPPMILYYIESSYLLRSLLAMTVSQNFLVLFWPHCETCGISIPWPGIESGFGWIATSPPENPCDFPCFWWPVWSWGVQVGCFIECPSTGIYLVWCFSPDHTGACVLGRKTTEVSALSHQISNGCTIDVAYPVDLNCHHLAQVEPVRFLHYSLSAPPPHPYPHRCFQAVFFGRKSPYAVIHLGVGSYPPTHSEYLLVNS